MNDSTKTIGTSFAVLVIIAVGIVIYAVASILNVPAMLRSSTVASNPNQSNASVNRLNNSAPTELETARRMSAYRQRISDLQEQVRNMSVMLDAHIPGSSESPTSPPIESVSPATPDGDDSPAPLVLLPPATPDASSADLRALRASVDQLLEQLSTADEARLLLTDANEQLEIELESLTSAMVLLEEVSQAATREAGTARLAAARSAAGALDQLGPDAMPLLLRSLEDERIDIQIWAAEVLEHMGEQALEALPLLRQLALDDDARLRAAAQEAIRELEGS